MSTQMIENKENGMRKKENFDLTLWYKLYLTLLAKVEYICVWQQKRSENKWILTFASKMH